MFPHMESSFDNASRNGRKDKTACAASSIARLVVIWKRCRLAFRQKFYETVEILQTDLDAWLKFDNTERPH